MKDAQTLNTAEGSRASGLTSNQERALRGMSLASQERLGKVFLIINEAEGALREFDGSLPEAEVNPHQLIGYLAQRIVTLQEKEVLS